MNPEAIILALIGLASGIIGSWVSIKIQRPVSQADAASKIEAASAHLVGEFKKDNDELRAEIDRLEESVAIAQRRLSQIEIEFNALLDGAWRLHKQVSLSGEVPVYTPPRKPITGPLTGVRSNE